MTAPFASDSEAIITQAHGQLVFARATHPDLTGAIELEVVSGRITWDESVAPRVQATLTVKVPDDAEDLAVLDPRTGVRVEIDAGYVRPGGEEDVHMIADLGVRRRRINRPDDTVTLELAGDEALVIDGSPSGGFGLTGTYAPDAITKLIKQTIVPYPQIVNSVLYDTEDADAISLSPVTDRWQTIDDLADQMDLDVYDNGLRTFYIEERPRISGDSALSLKVGANGTTIRSDTGLDRDPWFNYVILRYEWENTSDVTQRVRSTAYAAGGAFDITGPAGKKVYYEKRETPTTQAKANRATKALLRRFLGRGQSTSLQAVSAYWLRPGHTVTIQGVIGPQETHLVSRVSFDLLDGTMDVDTRVPDYVTPIDTTTPTEAPVPVDPDPEPTPVQRYVSTWEASNSQSYKGTGAQRTDNDDLPQGQAPWGSNGNERSLALFTASNSTGDEKNKSITTALSGATISKIEVYLYAEHWYYNNGGTARLGYYNGTSIPSTLSSPNPYVTKTDWPKPGGRWVNVTSSAFKSALLAGTARGITIGPGKSSYEFYGRFHSHTGTNPPRLRITYSK